MRHLDQTTRKQLKERVDALEKTLLAIDSLSHVAQEHYDTGMTPLEGCVSVLHYLIEPAMLQVESLRTVIDELQEGRSSR